VKYTHHSSLLHTVSSLNVAYIGLISSRTFCVQQMGCFLQLAQQHVVNKWKFTLQCCISTTVYPHHHPVWLTSSPLPCLIRPHPIPMLIFLQLSRYCLLH